MIWITKRDGNHSDPKKTVLMHEDVLRFYTNEGTMTVYRSSLIGGDTTLCFGYPLISGWDDKALCSCKTREEALQTAQAIGSFFGLAARYQSEKDEKGPLDHFGTVNILMYDNSKRANSPLGKGPEESLSLAEMEKELIEKALKKHKGKRRSAAVDLGISERTLYRKIKEYEIPE